ncbi:hypothetical protein PPTG_22150 [Phytophthora nicotianae INRA-310]|uniref:Uncharacterized protein n=1 Tax=Phytophthora nicotianae (strain INRA-310) TaxID=761204 RepID=W2QQL3_PHYN3|nr:hypothetical protein PPTG_22150 [Phytophthora nicotianae INRA-310]ETN14550.1 hypothetical protein PPTG_22150 [Phytophthora nicotianae INRA-310]
MVLISNVHVGSGVLVGYAEGILYSTGLRVHPIRLSKGITFSTIDDKYITSTKATLLAFPYLLTNKSGIYKEIINIVYDSMLTTKGYLGLSATLRGVVRSDTTTIKL